MTRSMDDDFTYFVKLLDETGQRFYLKSSIDERASTMIMRLTDLRSGWMGTRESVTCPCRQLDMFRRLVNRNQVHALTSKFPADGTPFA
jgi:hypothetical protein